MIVYRLSAQQFKDDLSGKGAEKFGGRWNSKGVPMLYTSQSRALCLAEIAVHTPFGIIPKNYYLVSIFIPDKAAIQELDMSALPPDWRSVPHSDATQRIGDQFIKEGLYLVLKVPSAVVPGDYNYLLNPAHKMFSGVHIITTELFEFDSRMFRR